MSATFAGFDVWVLVILVVIFVFGGMVKGALGFGLPLTTMAILPFVVPVDFALAINALVLPLTNVAQFCRDGRMGETISRFRFVILGVAFGVPVGAALVHLTSDAALLIFLGVFVLLFVGLTLARPALAIAEPAERPIGLGVGLAAGVVGAMTTANGPLFVMYLLGLKVDRRLFVSALSLLFIVSGVLISGIFVFTGLIDGTALAIGALCVPAALAGMALGNVIGERISADRFRLAVLVVLCLLAVNLVVKGATSL